MFNSIVTSSSSYNDPSYPPSTSSDPTPSISTPHGPSGRTGSYKPKRKRITPQQLEILVTAFENSDTPLYDIRERLAEELGMTNREVQVWFQNRRAKMARLRARTHPMDEQFESTSQEPVSSMLDGLPQEYRRDSNSSLGNPSRPAIQISATRLPSLPDDFGQYHDTEGVARSPSSPSNSALDDSQRSILPSQHEPYRTFRFADRLGDRGEGSASSFSSSSRASATESWLSTLPRTDQSSSEQSLASAGTSISSPTCSDRSLYSSNNHLSVRSAPSRLGGFSCSSSGNQLLGPAPQLPQPQTDFLNLSVGPGRPVLPLPAAPLGPLIPLDSSDATCPRRLSPLHSWYSGWPDSRVGIAQPPHWQPQQRSADQSNSVHWDDVRES